MAVYAFENKKVQDNNFWQLFGIGTYIILNGKDVMGMCGIAGILNLETKEATITSMLQTMARRGPDGNGVYSGEGCTLLHSRLAVIDPEGGKQPMILDWAGERFVLVYNGELYNTEELRNVLLQKGHRFLSHSDSEVVLHAYAEFGEKCVDQMNGIFAFAVWEERRNRLFLARDRIGVKPLFYCEHESGLLFASEIKTILKYPSMQAELDGEGVAQILLLGPGRLPGSGVFRGIKEIEPGYRGYYTGGKLRLERYWHLTDREHTDDFQTTAERVRELVLDAIKRQMVSDVPIGTFLSGGLDSSLITAVCAREMAIKGEQLKTFSVDYAGNDTNFQPSKFQPDSDNSYICLMKNALDTNHHWTVLTPDDLLLSIEDATVARDLPGMGDVDFSLLAFCKNIRQDVTVALSGECADEIFGGYPWFRDPQIRSRDGFPWAQNTKERAAFLSQEMRSRIDAECFVQDCYQQTIVQSDVLPEASATERRMKEMVNLNMRWFMQTLLDRKDRMSMYCGLEVRVPFCDYRIAEYMYGVPWEYKDYGGCEKGLLRYAMADLLPKEVLNRKKSPYPKTYDPRYLQLLCDRLRCLLADGSAPIFQIIDREHLKQLLTAEYAWPWYGQLMRVPQTICYMLQVDSWLRNSKISIV